MANASATDRASAPRRNPVRERPRLQVVGPPTRRRAHSPLRPTLIVAAVLVVGSLLFVAGAEAYMTQQQVRLTAVQARLSVQAGEHHDLELRVAQLSNPSHVVSAAQRQGLTVPSQVTDLPPVTVPPDVTHRGRHSSTATKAGAPTGSGSAAPATGGP